MADPAALATPSGFLLVLALLLPVSGSLFALALGGRHAERIALVLMPAGLVVAVAIVVAVLRADAALVYVLGGWAPPLGLALRADGLSAAMMLTTAVVICATGLFARADFQTPRGVPEARAPLVFWTLLLGVWAGLNAVLLGDDLFTLYVALELLTFGAVPLVCLDGRAETLAAALRYLLFALLGSVLYLLGTALLFGAYGTLDIVLLSERVRAEPASLVAATLMTVGLLAKTALFPLHLWLPPAHAGAPAPASAVLSALVVKGSFILILRLWFDVMPALLSLPAAHLLAALGAAAILFGSVLALRQARLKMLIAYSTVAQIGYLFLMFPLVASPQAMQAGAGAWTGGLLQAISHACAKAAMFMAAGLIAQALGHDRIAGLGGIGRALPMTMFAFALAGLSLMGLPPSGGFTAKWLLLVH
jgi:multicomponent Na+:H+ antiporter subunit D